MFPTILSSLQSIIFETCTVKIAKITGRHFWTILTQIGSFLNFLTDLKKKFSGKL